MEDMIEVTASLEMDIICDIHLFFSYKCPAKVSSFTVKLSWDLLFVVDQCISPWPELRLTGVGEASGKYYYLPITAY